MHRTWVPIVTTCICRRCGAVCGYAYRLADWEVNDMLAKVEEDLEEAYADPTLLAHELLHRAAFSGGLSNPLLPDPANLYGLTGDVLREYVAKAFTSGNMAVVAAGANFNQLQQVRAAGLWVVSVLVGGGVQGGGHVYLHAVLSGPMPAWGSA